MPACNLIFIPFVTHLFCPCLFSFLQYLLCIISTYICIALLSTSALFRNSADWTSLYRSIPSVLDKSLRHQPPLQSGLRNWLYYIVVEVWSNRHLLAYPARGVVEPWRRWRSPSATRGRRCSSQDNGLRPREWPRHADAARAHMQPLTQLSRNGDDKEK